MVHPIISRLTIYGSLLVVTSLSIPELCACGRSPSAHEGNIIWMLGRIAEAQRIGKEAIRLDRDGDGVGEFAYLTELAGRGSADGSAASLGSPFRRLTGASDRTAGFVRWDGYYFELQLPGENGEWIPEDIGRTPEGRELVTDEAERRWRCFAWPANVHQRVRRAFRIDESGAVTEIEAWQRDDSGELEVEPWRSWDRDRAWVPLGESGAWKSSRA